MTAPKMNLPLRHREHRGYSRDPRFNELPGPDCSRHLCSLPPCGENCRHPPWRKARTPTVLRET